MILYSTYLKLVKAGAKVYRVDFDAFTVLGETIAAHSEHFATKRAAEKRAAGAFPGLAVGKVSEVLASSFDALTSR